MSRPWITLRKGPRGGGRDRAAVVEHVVNAERAYAGKIGLRARDEPDLRAAIVRVLRRPSDGSELRPGGWTSRYAARRIIWHVLDHIWEIEDRSDQVARDESGSDHRYARARGSDRGKLSN